MRRSYDMDYRPLFWTCVVVLLIGLIYLVNFSNKTTEIHRILSIDKVEATSGNSDGFYTDVYYQVSTDRGSYRIKLSGFNAAPECAGIKKDSSYVLTTRGIRFPFLGYYPSIIEARK